MKTPFRIVHVVQTISTLLYLKAKDAQKIIKQSELEKSETLYNIVHSIEMNSSLLMRIGITSTSVFKIVRASAWMAPYVA